MVVVLHRRGVDTSAPTALRMDAERTKGADASGQNRVRFKVADLKQRQPCDGLVYRDPPARSPSPRSLVFHVCIPDARYGCPDCTCVLANGPERDSGLILRCGCRSPTRVSFWASRARHRQPADRIQPKKMATVPSTRS
jgi:hypothetical protein